MRTPTAPLVVSSALAVVCAALPARAELWASTLGDLLRDATRVEVVEVLSESPAGTSFRITESLRGHPVGGVETLPIAVVSPVAVGERVMIVCDRSLCPRAVGRLQHGVYSFRAYEPGDGAWLRPSVAEPASVALMTRRASAPPLCLRASVTLASSPSPEELTLRVSASDGAGTARSALVPFELDASAQSSETHGDGVSLGLAHNASRQQLAGAITGRDPDGCTRVTASTRGPLARTADELRANLSAAPVARPIARGTATLTAGGPIAAGSYTLTLSSGPNGELSISGLPGLAPSPSYYRSDTTTLEVGYPRVGADSNAVLRLRLRVAPGGPQDAAQIIIAAVERGPHTIEILAGSTPAGALIGHAQLSRATR